MSQQAHVSNISSLSWQENILNYSLIQSSLTTAKTVLHQFTMDDLAELFQLYSNPDTMKFLGGALSWDETTKVLSTYIEHSQRYPFSPLAIRDLKGKFIGRTGLRISQSSAVVDLYSSPNSSRPEKLKINSKIQLGYVIHPDFRNQGIATEVARQVIDFGFRCLNLEEIAAFVRIENIGSIRILRDKLQMQYVGSFCFEKNLWEYHSLKKGSY